jgi:hypothetical protein
MKDNIQSVLQSVTHMLDIAVSQPKLQHMLRYGQ